MVYKKSSVKSLDELDQSLRDAAARHKFGVLNVRDLKQTMNSKGVAFDDEVRVYDVCNPHHARTVLLENLDVSTALPCRISVCSSGGRTEVATILPGELMKMFSATPAMAAVAAEVESAMKAMIDEAV
jgi:uncharacterized protein (DUF302 family)